jgi:ribosome-binding ATPase YchF (GTP1/OBG family)
MKIAIISLPEINPGKHNLKDSRLDEMDKLVRAKKKTYAQVEAVSEELIAEADAVLAAADCRADLILRDLEFCEARLGRSESEKEKELLNRIKSGLEKEQFVSALGLSPEERSLISGLGFLTLKPVILAQAQEAQDINALLRRCLREAGYISFFTAGERETRAWLIKKGATAWEASGAVHSDIQKGFIRAEIIACADFVGCGGESAAKQQGKMRLEPKEYVMQDADWANFRFSK